MPGKLNMLKTQDNTDRNCSQESILPKNQASVSGVRVIHQTLNRKELIKISEKHRNLKTDYILAQKG